MSDTTLSRRDFLQRAAIMGVAVAGAGAILSACDKGGSGASSGAAPGAAPSGSAPQAASLDCTDVSGLSDPQKATRTNNAYVEKTAIPAQDCANCALYTLPKEEGGCGGCAVVAGPINPAGWCKLWVAQA